MFESVELGRSVEKAEYKQRVPALREQLLDAQFQIASADFSVVVVIAGLEGSGKGETVNRLLEWLDARGIATHAMGAPSEEERDRPEFFRFWRRLPARGRISIFFGSWYTQPITAHALGKLGEAPFERELQRIVEFERMLSLEKVLLIKLWLHIDKHEQKHRFEKLESDRDTAWRVTKRDWRFHEAYEAVLASASWALRRTSTGEAPWALIEATDRRFRDLSVGEQFLERASQRLQLTPSTPGEPEPLPVPDAINPISVLDLGLQLTREEFVERRDHAQARLGRLVRRLTDSERSLVIVFEGSDAAGKGGCIRRIVKPLDARFCRVHSIAAPTDEERARPYLWRFWRRLPRKGKVAIFDRSWYGRVLVERVEGFAEPADWRRAYSEINAFEEQLVEADAVLLKFWLAISPEEQLRRFEEREATGHKRYKITDDDWRNRAKWEAYEAAACEMIERTSSEGMPWTLIEAEDKRYARVKVLETVVEALERALD